MEKDNNNKDTNKKETTAKEAPEKQTPKEDSPEASQQTTSQGADNAKALAVIAYIGILWIVPLVAAQDSDFAMYHANQGLNLFIVAMIIFAIGLIPILGWIIAMFGWIAVVIFMIIGIVNAANGKKKPLPIIGQYKLLDK